MLRRYPEPSAVIADATKPERSQGARPEEAVAASCDAIILHRHAGRRGLQQGMHCLSWRQSPGHFGPGPDPPSVGRSHLNGSQLRTVVFQTMPLTAPGSFEPDEYAAVMAYLLSYDCAQPAGRGQQEFPPRTCLTCNTWSSAARLALQSESQAATRL